MRLVPRAVLSVFLLLGFMCISFQVIILSRQETSMTSQSQAENELLTNFVGSVVYNRAPKCASTTMRRIIIQLSRHEEALFKLHLESKPFIKQKLNLTEQEELVHSWSVLPTPTIFIRHLHYIDFTRFGYVQPSYINVIREPVARYVSAYYFNRFGFVGWGDTKVKKWLPGMTDEKRYMTLDDCVLRNVTTCLNANPSPYLVYFCGHDERCSYNTEWTLERAKQNVIRNYAVVGITEDMDNTIRLLEHKLPRFFHGAGPSYKTISGLTSTRTARKVEPSDIVARKLTEALSLEIRFYEFVKERFYDEIKKIGIVI